MLVVSPNKGRVQELKAQLARDFDMKDLGPENKTLGCKYTKIEKVGRYGFPKSTT